MVLERMNADDDRAGLAGSREGQAAAVLVR
jgi:hypothetical protein